MVKIGQLVSNRDFMRIRLFSFILISIYSLYCGEAKPIAVEIKDVCSQSLGTNVTIQGYLSLPQMLEFTKFRRSGQSERKDYKLFLSSQKNESEDKAAIILLTSESYEPNKIKDLPERASQEDIILYTNDGKTITAEKLFKLTGKVNPNDKNGCQVNVTKIENP